MKLISTEGGFKCLLVYLVTIMVAVKVENRIIWLHFTSSPVMYIIIKGIPTISNPVLLCFASLLVYHSPNNKYFTWIFWQEWFSFSTFRLFCFYCIYFYEAMLNNGSNLSLEIIYLGRVFRFLCCLTIFRSKIDGI